MNRFKNITKGFIMALSSLFVLNSCQNQNKAKAQQWLVEYDFEATQFISPKQEFGPFARWWWPGNDVDSIELKREIGLFANNAFGGVEIQPFSINVPMPTDSVRAKVLSWDTPGYYQNLKAVMGEAQKKGIIVDLTDGSGWPAGGPFLNAEDGFLNLKYDDIDLVGGETITFKIPTINNDTEVPSKLIAVLASKAGERVKKTTPLDGKSTVLLTNKVINDSITWDVPEGHWKVLAFWSKPNSLTGSMVAGPKQGPVLNYLDSTKVVKNLAYLLREETGLAPYFGNPLRAIFDDSYEFTVDRHFSKDFIEYFKAKRGYDITPWLPANMARRYNYVSFKNPNAAPDFLFGAEDWRLRYDYDLTISELFGESFITASGNWLEERGMLHRTQAYGMYMDMIANAGRASIPETESMLSQEANLKIMTSGAHLYNRPVISAESAVMKYRAYMTTPQKLRLAVDKLFAAGVNQVIYHGVPYKYITNETTDLGWYPFYMGFIGFSAHLGEGTQFWKYQKEVNEYVARTQYALRAGKSQADVLLYYPYMDVEGLPDNPTEIFTVGYLPDVEPPLKEAKEYHAKKEKEEWAAKVYPVINQLEANGITWDWVNDASIQAAKVVNNQKINIRGNEYQALMLVGIDVIQLNTAKHIRDLAEDGMKFAVVGDIPSKQPSFLNWEENDQATTETISLACKEPNSNHFAVDTPLDFWLGEIDKPVKFKDKYHFSRQVERVMSDGSRIQYIWNKSNQWRQITLKLNEKYTNIYWLNAENGSIIPVKAGDEVSYELAPYSTIILYASAKEPIAENLLGKPEVSLYYAHPIFEFKQWGIQCKDTLLKDTVLFDWNTDEQLKYTSEDGVYKAKFQLVAISKHESYLIDLGKVCYTATVLVNGHNVGQRINSPYAFDVTKWLKEGENIIEVSVTPGQLNGLIGEGEKGNPRYRKFKGRSNDLMSGGLIGPVTLYKK
ncbi:hypothetical protein BZG01_12700 [Labilibaculum manganireducens]|uniref:Beta-mannosidase-like galactose-binding domain-containing protein n=1 Tax=Labilibaculum manganireducens TaxID=1940525 RepID=A0A2N3I6S6_9BACT|nr:glycosyl hydrolase [Labilibaculum manganireducens]PKQ66010.1 hypothetical protein BZG01_12700 [Labilibaculum manganireducens]